MPAKRGFTLIELLAVIAIIGILTAIIFPVFARAKVSANRSSDLGELNALRSALQLYRLDQGGYPPQLLGYVTLYQSGPNAGNVIPADQLNGFLYNDRIESIDAFRPAELKGISYLDITTAVYPNQDPRPVGTAPILDLNGDGSVDAADDTAGARQAFGPADGPVCLGGGVVCATPAEFYTVSGYDVSTVPANPSRTELRYTLFWTDFALNQNGSAFDDPRQLGYSDPPDSTVVTWDSYFRDWEGGTPSRERIDIVLFLGGNARTYDSLDIHERSWRVTP